jgi:hypothetical protein
MTNVGISLDMTADGLLAVVEWCGVNETASAVR